jgi:DNA-binding response OmpR family regulator
VLLVDSDENVLRLLGLKLEQAGFDVDIARTAAAARDAARRAAPDVAVIGDGLDDGAGDGLAGSLLAGGPGWSPLIVVLSPQAGIADIATALEHGADDYIVKPFSPREVVHRLRVALLRRDRGQRRNP